jgi:carboxypeptidase family protein
MRREMAGWLLLAMAVSVGVPRAVSAGQGQASGVHGVVTTRATAPRPLRVTFDQNVCGAELPDQSIVVDPQGHLANVVVSVAGVKARTQQREVKVLNEKCAFVPRVQVVATKGTVRTSSVDPVLHTTTVQLADGRQLFNLALPVPKLELAKPLEGTGALRVGCSTHQWMRGWLYATDEMAVVTGPDGRFTLPGLPPGTYQLRFWHEALKAADRTVTVAPGKVAAVNVTLQ